MNFFGTKYYITLIQFHKILSIHLWMRRNDEISLILISIDLISFEQKIVGENNKKRIDGIMVAVEKQKLVWLANIEKQIRLAWICLPF